jgi:hypothetical protein
MDQELKNILSHLSAEIDPETLLLYLQEKLSAEKKHEVEKKLLDNEFAGDALEGLQQFADKNKITVLIEQLNHELHRKLEKKKQRRERLRLKDQPWIYLAVLIFLLLIIISYLVIHKMAIPR